MKSFTNKVAVVTGGGGTGIGHELVRELARRGAHVAFCDITRLETTEQLLYREGHRPVTGASAEKNSELSSYYSEQFDIGDREAVQRFCTRVLSHFGQVDILINNAGIANGDRSYEQLSFEDFELITRVNYWGVIHTTQVFWPHLLKRPEAAIANISSSQGILGLPNLVPYCTTKFAVRGFTDTLRIENQIRGIKNVTVHTVHPGAVATSITRNAQYQSAKTEKFHAFLQKQGVSPEHAARVILKGIVKNKGRIFISDGRLQDIVARLFPGSYAWLIRYFMKQMDLRPVELTT